MLKRLPRLHREPDFDADDQRGVPRAIHRRGDEGGYRHGDEVGNEPSDGSSRARGLHWIGCVSLNNESSSPRARRHQVQPLPSSCSVCRRRPAGEEEGDWGLFLRGRTSKS